MALPSAFTTMGTTIFWVILIAPLVGIALHLAIRWEVFGYDADSDRELDLALDASRASLPNEALCPSERSA